MAGWHALIEAVRHDDDNFQRVPDVRNSVFEFDNSAKPRSADVSKWEVFYGTIYSGSCIGGKGGGRSTLRVS